MKPEPDDVEYLLRETGRVLPGLRVEKGRVIAAFAGLRPLAADQRKDPWSVGRSHRIHEDPNGLVSVVGGKFTTYRKIAQDAVDWVARRFPEKTLTPCRTAEMTLGTLTGGWRAGETEQLLRTIVHEEAVQPSLAARVNERYGDEGSGRILFWLKENPSAAQRLCPQHPFIRAEVRYAVEEEMALSLGDLLWRRLQVGWSPCGGLDCGELAARWMGEILNWSDEERLSQIARYQAEAAAARSALRGDALAG